MKKPRSPVSTLVLAAVLLLPACGETDESPDNPGAARESGGESRAVGKTGVGTPGTEEMKGVRNGETTKMRGSRGGLGEAARMDHSSYPGTSGGTSPAGNRGTPKSD